jgi:hypothetical protein
VAAANAFASAGVLIIGAMMASAPPSARLARESPTGTRTTGAAPP